MQSVGFQSRFSGNVSRSMVLGGALLAAAIAGCSSPTDPVKVSFTPPGSARYHLGYSDNLASYLTFSEKEQKFQVMRHHTQTGEASVQDLPDGMYVEGVKVL